MRVRFLFLIYADCQERNMKANTASLDTIIVCLSGKAS